MVAAARKNGIGLVAFRFAERCGIRAANRQIGIVIVFFVSLGALGDVSWTSRRAEPAFQAT